MLVDSAEAIAIAREVMRAGGCTAVAGRPPAGAVWVVLPQAPAQRFDCGSLAADSAQRLARLARTSVLSTGSGAHAYSDPGYWEITTEAVHSCSGPTTFGITPTGEETRTWVDVWENPDGQVWKFWLQTGVPITVSVTTCSWVEKITARKFDGGGTPVLPAPGEYPNTNPEGGGGPSRYPTNEPQLVSVTVTPGERTLQVGEIAQFQATLTYDNGAVVASAGNVTWSAGSPIAVVDDYGTFQTNGRGLTTITARLGTVTGSASLVLHDQEFLCDLRNDQNFGGQMAGDSALAAYLKNRCLQEFGAERLDTLRNLRTEANSWLRPTASFTDSVARIQCAAALDAADSLLSGGLASIWMGKDSSVYANQPPHNAQANPGSGEMHFDPNFWRNNIGSAAGRRKIFVALLHEAVHAVLGSAAFPQQANHGGHNNPNYAGFAYFKFIEVAGPNSCLLP